MLHPLLVLAAVEAPSKNTNKYIPASRWMIFFSQFQSRLQLTADSADLVILSEFYEFISVAVFLRLESPQLSIPSLDIWKP